MQRKHQKYTPPPKMLQGGQRILGSHGKNKHIN